MTAIGPPFRLLAALAMLCAVAASAQVEVKTLAGPLDGAVGGVTVDALGILYVADFGEKVWKVSPWGEVEVFVDSLYGTSGNTIDAEGNLLQSSFNAGTLSKVTRDGKVTTLARGLAGPVGVTVQKDGLIYVCNCSSNVVSRVTPAGEVSDFASGEPFNCPNGITRGADGRLYVANFSDGRVIEIDKAGQARVLATLPGGGNGHLVAVGDDLYVTAFRANMVFKVSTDGVVTPFAGTGAFGEDDGPAAEATFSTPNGIAYDPSRDVLYVNDRLEPWPVRWEGRSRPESSVRAIVFPTLEQLAWGSFERGGGEALKKAVRAYTVTRPGRPYEIVLNSLGYRLLGAGELELATAVFELNSELFPQSFNVWDSLGEARKAAGDRERAIESYRRSLELNPKNANAAAMLEELEASKN